MIFTRIWIICSFVIWSPLASAKLSPHPKLLLISFDGFRYDLLNATWTPNIYKWANRSSWFVNGVRSQYVTYTAPNHMSIVTGLHEPDHGIVSNYFYDPATGKVFDYFNSTQEAGVVNASLDMSWYKGDPIWLTNERSDSSRRSVSFYWPNGEAPFPQEPHKPSLYRAWKDYRNLTQWMGDVDDIVNLFTDDKDPINFLAWYIAEPDHTLHKNGFYNGALRPMIHQLDELFGYLVAKLHDSGLESELNVILTADHGHAEIQGAKNVMCLREYITSEGYVLGDHMMYPESEELAFELYHNLSTAARTMGYKVKIYLKENIPDKFFYKNSTRIGRIVIEPEVGWAASFSKSCTRKKLLETYGPGKIKFNSSSHGMDPDRWEMRAMLAMGGPSFIPGKKITDIPNNIDLHSLMCYLLAIEAAPNNAGMSVVSQAILVKTTGLPHVDTSFSESLAFTFLIIPSACIVVLFMVYICRNTVLSDNPKWMWTRGQYRPLHMDIFDAERLFSMSLLPKSTVEFTDPKFWKNFFATRKTPFEWYGDYTVLGAVLEKYLKMSDNILQIGCGNSQLAAQMYDNGFRNVHSIDTDSAVIEEQRHRNRERSELTFSKDDATSMSFGDEEFSVIVDKGTLDALLPPEATEQQLDCVHRMFHEVQRILKVAGRYLIITLAQHHIVNCFMEHFLTTGQFLLRVHEIENSASGFPMPVFVFVATKLRNVMNMSMPIELWRAGSDRFEKFVDLHDVLSVIASEQEFNQFVHMCSRVKDILSNSDYKRYNAVTATTVILTVGCTLRTLLNIGVVNSKPPIMRRTDVRIKLDHEASITIESQNVSGPRYCFHIVDDPNVKTFNSYAVFVIPLGREGEWIFSTEKGRKTLRQQAEKIDFLSTGSVDVRVTKASGESSVNGKWTVEDIVVDGQEYRRLIFLSSSNIVQSEALLKSKKGGKKAVDLEHMTCDHHTLMLSGLALLSQNPLSDPAAAQLKVAVLGLGGGLLASFLLRHLPKATIEGVELDRDVVTVAIQWFALPHNDPRMRVKVVNALDYLEETSTRSVIAMNLVTRDEEVARKAKRSMASHFPTLYSISSDEDVNEVLLARVTPNEKFNPVEFARSLRKDIRWVHALEPVIARITPVPSQ
ncbi:hypothetical protein GCK32_004167 [Trichostrongylus colubriformis]|uniref:Methyltransferase domain-containing protein n=1 Tax=Trichostrongylus colubriformis TaxID=6319 RepID=A0AAN8GDL9_TRICO